MRSFLVFACMLFAVSGFSQAGCRDPRATNFSAAATSNDGSCSYPATSITLASPKTFSSTLNETSSLIYTDGGLWTLNDSGNQPQLFLVNSGSAAILKTVTISNATNVDWEEMTADANYFYIGDFGNNATGERTDLKIYRVLKSDIGAGAAVSVTADIIYFSYPDQVITAPGSSNNTKFDCESMIIKNNLIHLFTKDWVSGHTQHYSVPLTPGTYVASKLDEFNVTGLITGASISANNEIVLLGYTSNFQDIFMWLLDDYTGDDFFSGNKRKFDLGHTVDLNNLAASRGQAEGITFTSATAGYVSSEKLTKGPINIPPGLYSFDIASYVALPVKLTSFNALYADPKVKLEWQTSSEINNDYFAIQRSGDGVHFTEIGKQPAFTSADQEKKYRYDDEHPVPGKNYYRLEQVDRDGKATVYLTRAVMVPARNGSLRVSVTASLLEIESGTHYYGSQNYWVMNTSGAVVSRGILQSEKQFLNISNFPRGGYFLRVGGQSVKFIR